MHRGKQRCRHNTNSSQTAAVAGIVMVREGTCHMWRDHNRRRNHDHRRSIAIRGAVGHTAPVRTTVTAEPTKAPYLHYFPRNHLGRRWRVGKGLCVE
jgi:hypothetical protein